MGKRERERESILQAEMLKHFHVFKYLISIEISL